MASTTANGDSRGCSSGSTCRGRRPDLRIRRATRARWQYSKKELPAQLQGLAAQHPEARLQLWCQEEARFGQKGRTTRKWYERGLRPPGVVNQRFKSLNLFAACRPGTHETFALALPRVNADAMDIVLEQFACQLETGVHAVLILDQAGWQDARALHVPETITLLSLPSAPPQLNPVERVWLYLRERYLSHRVLDDLDAVGRAWNRLLDETGRFTTLATYPYLTASAIP
jgi:hypothetical protein